MDKIDQNDADVREWSTMSEENRPVDEEQAVEEQAVEEQETAENKGVPFEDTVIEDNSEIKTLDEFIKPSGKTTALLISTVLVLVAIVAIAVVLIVKNLGDRAPKTDTPDIMTEDPNVKTDFDVDVKLGKYRGVKVSKADATVTDEDVEADFKLLISSLGEETVVPGPVESGDVCNIDFAGYMGDEQFEGGTDWGYDLEIGSGSFIDGFEEQLIGASSGDTLDVNVTFPDPYPDNLDYSGKPARFVVTINSITRNVAPEITDELINQEFSYPSVAAYKEYIRSYLQEEANTNAIAEQEEEAFNKIIADSVFTGDLEEEIEAYYANLMNYWNSVANSYYGVDATTLFMYMYGIDAASFENLMRDQSSYSVKYKHVLSQIAKEENITVTAAEYREQYEYIFFQYYGLSDDEEVSGMFSTEEIDKMVNDAVLQEKAHDIVTGSMIVE